MTATFRQLADVTCPVIDADAHVNEPPDLWQSRVAPHLRERAPKLLHADFGDVWSFDGGKRTWNLGLTATAGLDYTQFAPKGARYSEIRPASFDPKARLIEMDIDGIDAQVLYPSVTLTGAKSYSGDRELQLACVRAYNDWMAEFCADSGGRLVAQAVMPATNAADAAAELRHALDTGHRGVILSAFPNGGFTLDPTDDEFFGLAQEALVPLAVHTGSFLPNNPEGMWADLDGMGVLAMGSTAKAGVQSMPVAAMLVFSGVLERFPGLRFVLVESNIGWIPTLLEQMDDSFMRFRFYTGAVDKMRRLPSEVFRTSIWATFVNDRSGVEQRDRLNLDHVCWSTDYPHSICEWPNSRRVFESVFQGVALDSVEKMVYSNARDLYSIELPPRAVRS
ncbi:MAG: amidohydrolase family protein [Acidimicrobiales bacterium]